MRRTLISTATLAAAFVLTEPAFGQPQLQPTLQPQLRPTLQPYALGVTGVLPGSPAQRAGIEPGDVIVSVNGMSIRTIQDLNNSLGFGVRFANLGVIDVRTGWINQVMVYPVNGKIGVFGYSVPVNNVGPQPWVLGAK
jgi:membrane-associated protease RseP (regulator of RpoE activity)